MSTAHLSPAPPDTAAFRTRPLAPALGAEILGVDLSQLMSEALFARVLDAWHANCVILLRDQHISEDDQVRFAERFGPVLSQRAATISPRTRRSC